MKQEETNEKLYKKELKDDFNGGILSHKEFVKNEMDFLISSLAYNLYHVFQTNNIRRKRSDNTNEYISIEISENSSQSDTTRKTGNA